MLPKGLCLCRKVVCFAKISAYTQSFRSMDSGALARFGELEFYNLVIFRRVFECLLDVCLD